MAGTATGNAIQSATPPGSGSGTVTSVTAGDTSIVIGGTAAAPTVETATLDVIATDHPPAANWSNNSHKITSLANGSAAQDAAAFGQIPAALPPSGSAGGDLGSTYPNPTVVATHLASALPVAQGGTGLTSAGTDGQVLAVNSSGTVAWLNAPVAVFNAVTAYGLATGGTAAANTTALNAAITAAQAVGGVVYIPFGTYTTNGVSCSGAPVTIAGDGPGATIISVASTTANGITIAGTTVANVQITGLRINGPNSGTGTGISSSANSGANPCTQMVLRNLIINQFGVNGIALECPIVSTIDNVISEGNGGAGFYLYGGGTSTTCISSYAKSNASGRGWYLQQMSYSKLNGCASDNNALGYEISQCTAVNLSGCGAEATVAAAGLDGSSFKIDTSSVAVGLYECFSYRNGAVAFYITGSSQFINLFNLVESNPAVGATASIKSDTGTFSTLASFSVVTATALFGNSYNEINDGNTGESAYSGPAFYNSTASFFGLPSFYVGTDTSNTAAFSNPTFVSGTSLQVNSTSDCMLYIAVQTSAALSVSIGPSASVLSVICPSKSYAISLITLRVPMGYFVKLTGTMADLSISSITC